ncbi:MAG: cytochrome c oxidase subunit 3 [Terracidiphilus sp.]|nr:cytochrome c oxidase subunit 3 [Terracidiphilus sp.]
MPSTFTPTPSETERKEPGIGGKPPVDRRPTGGGGGGGDDEWKKDRRGPRELLHKVRFFVLSALAADMFFFAVLVLFFFARQAGLRMDPRTHEFTGDWRPVLLPRILYWNTAVLLLSSLTMERARQRIFREIDVLEEWLGLGRPALRSTLPWLGATLVLGTLFLAGQAMAWRQLTVQGFAFDRFSTPASYFFYMITGLHAAHLVVGLLALVFCLGFLGFFQRVEHRQVAVDASAWFWHTMSLAWLLLAAVLAFGQ